MTRPFPHAPDWLRQIRWVHIKAAALFILFALVTAGVAVAVAAVLEGM